METSGVSRMWRGLLWLGVLLSAASVTLAADRTVKLTVTVKSDDGQTPIPTAHVNVYQENITGSDWFARPPDHQQDTNNQGIARFDLKVKSGAKLKFAIEASREDMVAQREEVDLGTDLPPQVLRQFFLKARVAEKAEGTSTVKVVVKRKDKGTGIEGTAVEVRAGDDRRPGTGQTNANGEASVVTGLSNVFEVRVSKELFTPGSQRVQTKDKQAEVGPVEILLDRQSGTELTVNVTDDRNGERVGDALIVLDGPDYLRASTGASGATTITVTQPGTYKVRVTQQYYETLNDEITIAPGEETKAVPFELTAKAKKEEEKDTIEVTVLARDPSDKGSKPTPLRGAEVKIGRYTMATDDKGQMTMKGSFNVREEVRAQAAGYKTQTKTVGLNKLGRYAAGSGKATFTLEPELSETDPVRIIVEVRDPAGAPVPTAGVGFRLPDGTRLGGGLANEKGEVEFPAKGTPAIDPTILRKGMEVHVEQPGYLEHTSQIDASLLRPSTQPRRYSVQLDKDWTDLTKAVTQLEGRVNALRNEARSQISKIQSIKLLAAKSIAARGRAEAWLKELKAAHTAFDAKLSGTKCAEAAELAKSIEAARKEAEEKEKAFTKLLEEAKGLAASCRTKAEGAVVADKHRNAIRLIGEIGGLGSKANQANLKLSRFAEAMKEAGPLQAKLQQLEANIKKEADTALEESNTAGGNFNDASSIDSGLPGKRAGLLGELQALKTKFQLGKTYDQLPADLGKRMENLDQTLSAGGADLSLYGTTKPDMSRLDDVIKPNLTQIQQFHSEAAAIASDFKTALCKVESMDQTVEAIRTVVTNAGFELGLVADLPSKAQLCGAAATPSPTPTPKPTPTPTATPSPTSTPTPSPSASPTDELVTVPSVSGAESIDYARTILNQAGFKSAFKAIKPKEKKDELTIANTNPAAGEKAKRGSLVTVFIYQKWEDTATPTPSPTPTPVARGNVPSFIGMTLEQASSRLTSNMRIGGDEVGDAPPTPELALTIFSQTPAPGSTFDPTQPLVITVRRYGSAQATTSAARFDGVYNGSYRGADSGSVRFIVSGGSITITSPGSGSGTVSASGSASISGAGNDGASSYSFSGTFAIGANGKATASGRWSGQQSGYKGSGTWSAARP